MNISLQKWTLDDRIALMTLCNAVDRTYLSNRMPYPYTVSDAISFINMANDRDGKDGIFRSIAVDGHIVGNISVERKSDVYAKDSEIGYCLHPDYTGKGIMTAAIKEISHLAFSTLDILRLSALVYEPNIASCKVLENNGFLREGILKKAVFKNDTVYNLVLYGKTVE